MKWYLNINIATKFLIGYIVVILLSSATGILGIIHIKQMKAGYDITGLIILQVMSILIASSVAVITSSLISKPLRNLVKTARNIKDGKIDLKVGNNYKGEWVQVFNSLNEISLHFQDLINETQMLKCAIVKGNLTKRGNVNKFKSGYKEIISSINEILDCHVNHLDSVPVEIVLSDSNFNIMFANKALTDAVNIELKQLLGMKCYELMDSKICNSEQCPGKISISKGVECNKEIKIGVYDSLIKTGPVKDTDGNIIGMIEVVSDLTEIRTAQREAEKQAEAVTQQMETGKKQAAFQKNEVEKLIIAIEKLAKGELDIEFNVEDTDDEIKEVRENFKKINNCLESSVKTIKLYIDELSEILSEMAGKNFSRGIDREYLGDFNVLKD